MKLITETVEDIQILTENVGDKKHTFIAGPFIECNTVNRNGRYYDLDTVLPEITRYTNELVKEGRGVGELGHPPGPQINLDRVCIAIIELNQDNNKFIGKAQITETPCGHVVKGLMESGVKLGVSTRALGSLSEHKNGYKLVGNDLKLIAVDVVQDPSAPSAWVNSVMENVEWVLDPVLGWKAQEIVQESKKKIKKMNIRELNEKKTALFEDFITSLVKTDNL